MCSTVGEHAQEVCGKSERGAVSRTQNLHLGNFLFHSSAPHIISLSKLMSSKLWLFSGKFEPKKKGTAGNEKRICFTIQKSVNTIYEI